MFNRIRAWRQLLKLGKSLTRAREAAKFPQANIVRVFKKEGWFTYLDTPRTVTELAEKFHYTKLAFLQELVDALLAGKTLKKVEGSKIQTVHPLNDSYNIPHFFNEGIKAILETFANAIPDRLRGKYLEFSGGTNLFNWDEALEGQMYHTFRDAAFAYSDAINQSGKFLDIGCGNGIETIEIWLRYYHKNYLTTPIKDPVEIVGMDVDENLLRIAKDEFAFRLQQQLSLGDEEIENLRPYFPKFTKGSITRVPYADETFDTVYASQILHWTNPKVGISEMLRVTRPGGLVFGAQALAPKSNKYLDFHVRVIEDAHGAFSAQEFKKWALDAGAKTVAVATPIAVFKIVKKN
ncbi:MAG: class I SAM-dependent methyltransferase [Candidatus Hodarchaeota archaeon]